RLAQSRARSVGPGPRRPRRRLVVDCRRSLPGRAGSSRREGALHMIGFIVFGLVVGVIARLLVPGRQRLGLGMTLLLGLVGSVIGGVVANALGTGDIWELNVIGSLVAIAAAVVLITIGERTSALRTRTR